MFKPLLYVIKSQMHIGGEGRVIGAPDVPSKTFVKSFADKNAIQHNLRDPLELFTTPSTAQKTLTRSFSFCASMNYSLFGFCETTRSN
jgi:hypothetical protein